MKKQLLLIAMAVFSLVGSVEAKAVPSLSDFAGKYDYFLRLQTNSSGRISLIDSSVWKTYTVNVKNGQESPLDVDFLRYSREPLVQEYASYIVGATVAANMNSAGGIDFVIKAGINFEGGQTPQAVVVFFATSEVSTYLRTFTDWQYNNQTHNYELTSYTRVVKGIRSNLKLDHVEAPAGQSGSVSAYQFALSILAKLYPSEGISSVIEN